MARFQVFVHSLSRAMNWVAVGFLPLMVMAICVGITARSFGHPILGILESVKLALVIQITLAIAYTQVKRGHITVGIVMDRVPKRSQAVVTAINYLLLIVLSAMISWCSAIYALDISRTGSVTSALGLPYYFAIYAIALGFGLVALVFLVDFFDSLSEVRK